MSPGLALGSPWAHTEILGLTMQKQKFWAISEIANAWEGREGGSRLEFIE